jgi:hypothetical protein
MQHCRVADEITIRVAALPSSPAVRRRWNDGRSQPSGKNDHMLITFL